MFFGRVKLKITVFDSSTPKFMISFSSLILKSALYAITETRSSLAFPKFITSTMYST